LGFFNAIKELRHGEERPGEAGARLEPRTAPMQRWHLPSIEPRPSALSQEALGSLADITAALEQSIGRIAHRPEKVEMEFSASLTAECDRWIASGEGETEFKVALAWGNGE
jgi:hypothetical protein